MKVWAYEYKRDAAGLLTTDLKLDPNGERIILTDPITGERMVESEYVSETSPLDFTKAELVRLHQEKQKNDEKTAKLRAMAWAFLMKLTEIHHRDLIIPFSHMDNQPDQCKNAWAAIKSYYEGLTGEDRRVHLEAMWTDIPKLYKTLARRPTMREVNNLVSSIGALCCKFAQLTPSVTIDDFRKKSLFVNSLPPACDQEMNTIHSICPTLSFDELVDRWTSTQMQAEFKDQQRAGTTTMMGTSAVAQDGDGSTALYTLDSSGACVPYVSSSGYGGRSGNAGRGRGGRGNGRGRGGRDGGTSKFTDTCWYCNKVGHRET
jgi:hypothetical protein